MTEDNTGRLISTRGENMYSERKRRKKKYEKSVENKKKEDGKGELKKKKIKSEKND